MNDSSDDSLENSQLADELPSVEEPTAGFLVQLFVVPAIIVLAVVLVYVLFGKIATGETDPEQFRAALKSSNPVRRWQAAHNLAQVLEADQRLSQNQDLAIDLVELLEAELDQGPGSSDDERVHRAYLVTALGKFQTPLVVPVLRRAIKPPHAVQVRIRAILALMDLAERVNLFDDPMMVTDLIEASEDGEAIVRKVSAYAMGNLANPGFDSRLQEMLGDGDVDVRYNAALALARNGHFASVSVLVAMLDPGNPEAVQSESPEQREHKSSEVLRNALLAAEGLATKNQIADLSTLRGSVEALTEHPSPAIYLRARDVLRQLNERDQKQ
jgi:HEAT repeat protein